MGAPLFSMATTTSTLLASALDNVPGQLREAVVKELATGYHREMVNAEVQQKRIQGSNRQNEFRSIEGIGQLRMRVDPTLYHHWGQKIGYDCWKDNQFLKEVERDNPEVRVKCGGTRLQFGYAPTNTRFSKKY